MNWPTLQAAIKTAMVSALGVDATQVRWSNEANAATWGAFPTIRLALKNPRAVGIDQISYSYDADADEYQPTHEGNREFTIQVRLESDSQSPGADAVGYLASRMRTRIRWQSIQTALSDAGLAVSLCGPTQQIDYRSDGRMMSASITELVLLATESDRDTLSTGDYFETIAVSSES